MLRLTLFIVGGTKEGVKGMHNKFKSSKRTSRKNVEMVKKVSRHYFPEGVR